MKPDKKGSGKGNYERVACGDWLTGVLSDIKYDMEHVFTYQGEKKPPSKAARLVFTIEGYKFPHGTKWLRFSYAEKANLYKQFMAKLVEGAEPDMDFDLDELKGMKVKMIWAEQGEYQHIELIKPADGKKYVPGTAAYKPEEGTPPPAEEAKEEGAAEEEEIPF